MFLQILPIDAEKKTFHIARKVTSRNNNNNWNYFLFGRSE